ncbi:MAG: hypothetical protein EPO37_01355 [Nitrosarchaeum sp.]|nr:MAG: hypothetical protein EPO37_01355 [Nitrosarchaeum sp.]
MKKSAIISVRVDADTKNKLEIESEMKSMTLNTLIGQIITKHVSWDRFAEDIGFVFLTKPFLRAILSHVPEKEMTTIAVTVCRGAMKDATVYMYGELTVDTFIKSLDSWLAASHIPFRHIKDDDNTDKYVIQHELGNVFSQYLVTVINAILNEFKFRIHKQELTDQSVSFKIDKV